MTLERLGILAAKFFANGFRAPGIRSPKYDLARGEIFASGQAEPGLTRVELGYTPGLLRERLYFIMLRTAGKIGA